MNVQAKDLEAGQRALLPNGRLVRVLSVKPTPAVDPFSTDGKLPARGSVRINYSRFDHILRRELESFIDLAPNQAVDVEEAY